MDNISDKKAAAAERKRKSRAALTETEKDAARKQQTKWQHNSFIKVSACGSNKLGMLIYNNSSCVIGD